MPLPVGLQPEQGSGSCWVVVEALTIVAKANVMAKTIIIFLNIKTSK